MNAVLTIAGSDSSGGAGIQADIKTITAHGAYAMSVITALTAQNTLGVSQVFCVPADFVSAQLEAVLSDIPPQAVKIGMVYDGAGIAAIAQKLRQYSIDNIVIDPVMVSTSGSRLMDKDAQSAAVRELYPLARLLTPNIPEAEALAGVKISDAAGMRRAAASVSERFGCAVLCKGGHQAASANDLLFDAGEERWFEGRHIDNPNTHGTGCTLSSAIACQLAAGKPLPEAVGLAKRYLTGAILDGMNLGHGAGPLNHGYIISDRI